MSAPVILPEILCGVRSVVSDELESRFGRGGNEQFRALLRVHYGRDGDSEVRDWSPEIYS